MTSIPARYDQDLRFGSASIKALFWLVKFLEDVGYPRASPLRRARVGRGRSERLRPRLHENVCVLKKKARQWNADKDIQNLFAEINSSGIGHVGKYSSQNAQELLNKSFDRTTLAHAGLMYERLDQLTVDLLLGVR